MNIDKTTDPSLTKSSSIAHKLFGRGPSEAILRSRTLGVWELLDERIPWRENVPIAAIWDAFTSLRDDWPFFARFAKECYSIADPSTISRWAALHLVSSFVPAFTMYLSGQLLDVVQSIIEQKTVQFWYFYILSASLLLSKVMRTYISDWRMHHENMLTQRASLHFGERVLQIHLQLDVPTYQDKVVSAQLKQLPQLDRPWDIFNSIIRVISAVVQIISQLLVLFTFLHSEKGGYLFFLLACIQPAIVITDFPGRAFCLPAYFAHVISKPFDRMTRLKALATEAKFRTDIVGDGLQDFILSEHRSARSALGNTPTNHPWDLLSRTESSWDIQRHLESVSKDLPLILFALQSIRNPGRLPLKSLTILGSTSTTLADLLNGIQHRLRRIGHSRESVRTFYDAADIENLLHDGDMPYPSTEHSVPHGMKIEFKNVSFHYPSESKEVLKNLSFTIHPGQLCVIVGENGCGKSSTMKLLNRIYDVTSGVILVDDAPLQSYIAKDLRRAEAILHQDYVKYPLTIRENIAFGAVEHANDLPRIERAAKLADAHDIITKLAHGYETDVDENPDRGRWSFLNNAKEDGPLKQRIKAMENPINLSGGQWQRLAIARTFMRTGGIVDGKGELDERIKLVAFDEPSSALDPGAEFELFEKLRKMRGKKTMIFITHRFGHLTKYADLILYMKEGSIIESGTHQELLSQKGAYSRLYNVQAQAFSPAQPSP